MADKYRDFEKDKRKKLEKQVNNILEKEEGEDGEVHNYYLKEEIDWEKIGWSEETGAKALVFLRRTWKEEGRIKINTEKDGSVTRKEWVQKK